MAASSANRICLAVLLASAAPAAAIVVGASPAPRQLDAKADWKAREMEIYTKYWWPLEPPPYHHPGTSTTEREIQACQALEGNYTRYWASLPKFKPSPRLLDVQKTAYFKDWSWRAAKLLRGVPAEGGAGPVSEQRPLRFICHHKTGENLHSNVIRHLPEGHFNITELYEVLPWYPDMASRPEGLKTIHLIRDPVDVILSGYRYHQNKWGAEIWSWGHVKLQDPQCFECDDADHYTIFDSCHFNCTYFELLNRLDETSGVVTEAVSARKTLTSMAAVMNYLSEDPNTLQVSMELLKADYSRSSKCLLKFLGLEGDAKLLDDMTAALQYVHDPDHVTSGLFDNDHLEAQLRSSPVWGAEFRKVRGLMDKIFQRQARLWGCPDKEAD